MTYGPSQKRAIYRYREKIRDTEAFKAKSRLYKVRSYAKLLENPAKVAAMADAVKLKYYYAGEPIRDIRRLFTWSWFEQKEDN